MEALPLRTGFGTYTENNDNLRVVIALMRSFSKDALTVAGRYACAKRRNVVSGDDMRRSLMYCAQTFFSKDEAEMQNDVAQEMTDMDEETDEEDEGERGEEEEDEDEEDSGGEEDEEDEYRGVQDQVCEAEDVLLAERVDTIANDWHLWQPEDPVLQLIKRAIDQTPC